MRIVWIWNVAEESAARKIWEHSIPAIFLTAKISTFKVCKDLRVFLSHLDLQCAFNTLILINSDADLILRYFISCIRSIIAFKIFSLDFNTWNYLLDQKHQRLLVTVGLKHLSCLQYCLIPIVLKRFALLLQI